MSGGTSRPNAPADQNIRSRKQEAVAAALKRMLTAVSLKMSADTRVC